MGHKKTDLSVKEEVYFTRLTCINSLHREGLMSYWLQILMATGTLLQKNVQFCTHYTQSNLTLSQNVHQPIGIHILLAIGQVQKLRMVG